jgi:hypothetical protein
VATLPGQRARSILPATDTPGVIHPAPDALSCAAAEAAWRSVTPPIAATPHVRVSRDGGRTFPARYARPLPDDPPGQPATVAVYDPGSATGRMLALDLDSSRIRNSADIDDRAVEQRHEGGTVEVGRQAAALGQLLEHLGVRYLADVAPSGGRHVYILFSSPLPWRELRDLCRAVSLRFSAVDPAPMAGPGGQISPPGSRHKSGGWRLLSIPAVDALDAVQNPNGPEIWAALLDEFAGELALVERGEHVDNQFFTQPELDAGGYPWVPRLGGRAPLGAELDRVARTGRWNQSRHPGRSEARMAILAAAVARGWRLTDVRSAVVSGAWKGLAALYERPSEPGRLTRLLPMEWRKAVTFVAGEKNVRHWLTSDSNHAPPAPIDGADEFGLIRQWVTGTLCAAADPERVKGWGRCAVAVRQLLAAIGQAAMVSGSTVLEFGTRNLSLHSGLSQRTVSRLLVMLRNEPDPLVDLVNRRQAARADRYQLRIPAAYTESVRWRRRRAGRIDGIHPAFLVLGGVAGLVHQVLDGTEARGAEVARAARLSPSATSAALRVLAEHGLAERGRGGWRRGDVSLDEVATSTGAADLQREREARYRKDRESWRARLRQYQAAWHQPVNERDGWLSLDEPDEYDFMSCRWPVLGEDLVRGPPDGKVNGITGVA